MKINNYFRSLLLVVLIIGEGYAQTWTAQTSGTTSQLNEVYFVSSSKGWIAGNDGIIKSTVNGGLTWNSQGIGVTTQSLNSIFFINQNTGWIVGTSGAILKTENSGLTWQIKSSGTDNNLNSVYFKNESLGWAVGSFGVILKTSDGGNTWSLQNSNTTTLLSSVYFVNENEGWIAGQIGWVLHTTDGGTTWSKQVSNKDTRTLQAVKFYSSNNGYIVGSNGTVIKTFDAGATWLSRSSGTVNSLNSMDLIADTILYAVGNAGTILKSMNGGESWVKEISGTANHLQSVHFPTSNNGWAVGAGGTILKYSCNTPNQPSIISGPLSQCIGTSQTYSVIKDNNASSYSWTLPAGWEGQSSSNSIVIKANANSEAGNLTVIASNGCGSSSASSLTLNKPSDVPAQPGSISGPSSQCVGTSQTYSVVNDNNASSYSWTLPAGWEGQSSSNSIVIKANANSEAGNLTVIASNGCGNSVTSSLMLSKPSDVPAQPTSISGPSSQCVGASQTYSVVNDNSASSYSWTLPAGWEGQSSSNSIVVKATANSEAGNITVIANNECGSSVASSLMVNKPSDVPSQPGVVSGPSSQCVGTSETYSLVNDNNASSYSWTFPTGWEGQSTSNSILLKANVNSEAGNLTVIAKNICGNSEASTFILNKPLDVPAQPGSISGPSSQCVGVFETYSVETDNNAISYSWTLPIGWEGQSNTNAILIKPNVGSEGGSLSVVAINGCGNSLSSTVVLNKASDVPAQPSTIVGSSVHCVGTSQIYSVSNDLTVNGYVWCVPSGWEGQSTSSTISIRATDNSVSGSLTVAAKNQCGSSLKSILTLNAPYNVPKPTITQNGNQLNTQALDVIYQWKKGQTLVGTNSATFSPGESGSYKVVITDRLNGCKDSSDVFEFFMPGPPDPTCLCDVVVFPNPAKDEIMIKFKNEQALESSKNEGKGIILSKDKKSKIVEYIVITIKTIDGKTVLTYREEVGKGNIKISLAGIPKGLYLLTIGRGVELVCKKLSIE